MMGERDLANERIYRDDEVSEIFALATDTSEVRLPSPADRDGLTLAELQEVGYEVGLTPERVAAAAAALETHKDPVSRRTWMGAPISVGRIVELPRAATDREWQVLVADLRETFGAKGRLSVHGDTRVWSNGNLFAFLEPTGSGHRLRLGTAKGGAQGVAAAGGSALAIGLLLLVTSGLDAATFGATFELLIPAVMATAGGGALAGKFLRLKRWAGLRSHQMEHIAGRARALLASPPPQDELES